jgi:type IV secretion system protein VirB6
MGFFAQFSVWLDALLATYIGENTARVAGALAPAVLTLAVLYVMVWGYLQLTGQIQQPFIEGIKRILTLSIVMAVALHLWLYNEIIVDTVFNAPGALAASIVGAYDSVGVVDTIIFAGADTGNLLMQKGGILDGNLGFYLAGMAVYVIVGLTAVYTIFLLSLSRIALAVLLALGPLFIALLFFETTKSFFEHWLAQLANYAFVTILTVLCAALMLHVVSTAANQAISAGGDIQISHALNVCMAAGLTFLVMRQVLSIASGLATGVALSSFGVMSMALTWAMGSAVRGMGRLSRSSDGKRKADKDRRGGLIQRHEPSRYREREGSTNPGRHDIRA